MPPKRWLHRGLIALVAVAACVGQAAVLPAPAFANTLPNAQPNAPVARTFYVAPDGLDSNSGTANQPFATIAQARDAVRSVDTNMRGDIVVKIEAGNYFLTSPIDLSEQDSGTNGFQVIYENDSTSTAPATIYGGTSVTGWSKYSGNVYSAPVAAGRTFYNLVEDKVMASPQATGVAGITAPGQWFLNKATNTLYYWPRTANIADALIVAPTVQDVFRVVGSSASAPAHNITIQGLSIDLTDYVASFTSPQGTQANADGQEFEYNKHGLVYLENANHVTVTEDQLSNAGLSGVWLNKSAQYNTISSNVIDSVGLNGVYLTGWDLGDGGFASPDAAYVNKFNTVTDNYITDVGKLANDPAFAAVGNWRGSGIQLYQSGDNLISHNTIRNGPRYGISQKGERFGAMQPRYYGVAVTYQNYKEFLYTRNNKIEFNDIGDVMQRTTDGGGIESWGPGAGNLINNNVIHDLRANDNWDNWFGGIYLDDGSDQTTVTNNIVYGVVGGSHTFPIMDKDVDNTIDNNIFADNQAAWDYWLQPFAEASYGLTLTHNISADNATSTAYSFGTMPGGFPGSSVYTTPLTGPIPNRLAAADNNLLFDPSNTYTVLESNAPTSMTFGAWQSSNGAAYDQHSVTGEDPQFVDSADHDYTVASTSPALALGFKNIDQASIGLTSAFPFDLSSVAGTSGVLTGGADIETGPPSHTPFVAFPQTGASVTLPVEGASTHSLRIHYSSKNEPGTATVSINGAPGFTVSLPATTGNSATATVSIPVAIANGANVITVTRGASDTAFHLYDIAANANPVEVQAASGGLSGGAVTATEAGLQVVNFPVDGASETISIPNSVNARSLEISYMNPGSAAQLHVSIDGASAFPLEFPQTASGTATATVQIPAAFTTPTNTITISREAGDSDLGLSAITLDESPVTVSAVTGTLAGGATLGIGGDPNRTPVVAYPLVGAGDTLTLPGSAGVASIVVHYSNANAGGTILVSVNGGSGVSVPIPSTGSWAGTATVTVPVTLTQTTNTITISRNSVWFNLYDVTLGSAS